jgi:hypothetical protein
MSLRQRDRRLAERAKARELHERLEAVAAERALAEHYPAALERAERAAEHQAEQDTPETRAELLTAVALVRETHRARHQAGPNREATTVSKKTDALTRARLEQSRIRGLSATVQAAISGLDGVHTQRVSDALENQRTGRPLPTEREQYDADEAAKARLLSAAQTAKERLATHRGELSRALAECGSEPGSDGTRASVRAQLQAGVHATAILEDAAGRYDLDTVRAVRAEVGPALLATAGNDQSARALAVQGREAAEFAADRVLARIGSGTEADVAKLRLGSVT